MHSERRNKHLGVRLTPTEYANFEKFALLLSEKEGRPVTMSALFMRLADVGLPILEQELGDGGADMSYNVLHGVSRSLRAVTSRIDAAIQKSTTL